MLGSPSETDEDTVVIRYGTQMLSQWRKWNSSAAGDWEARSSPLAVRSASTNISSRGHITHHYDRTIVAERVHGIIGTPIAYEGVIEGVLMGGSRAGTTFGDGAAR